MAEAMGLKCYGDKRFEADDLIGTLASYWRQRGHPIPWSPATKTSRNWWKMATIGGILRAIQKLGPAAVAEKFGVRPDQLADYLALTGDAVDNIPGVPGVGAKTAAALLAHFDTPGRLWERLAEVPHISFRGARSLAAKLQQNRAAADLARKLTGIEAAVAFSAGRPGSTAPGP